MLAQVGVLPEKAEEARTALLAIAIVPFGATTPPPDPVPTALVAGDPSPVAQFEQQLQVDLFAAPPAPEALPTSAVESALADINPDAMSPREVMDALYQLKALATIEQQGPI